MLLCACVHGVMVWSQKFRLTPELPKIPVCLFLVLNLSSEVFGLWFFWVRIQSCFANCESKSDTDPLPTRFKQSESGLSPGKYKSSKEPVKFFQKKENPNPTRIRLQERKPHSWSCWKQPESGSKKSKIQSMHTSAHWYLRFFRGKHCVWFWVLRILPEWRWCRVT